jgi:hypothetical protein
MNRRIAHPGWMATLAVALVFALVPVAFAARGGGGGKPSGGGSGQTLTGTVNASAGTFTVNGSGFQPGQAVSLAIAEAGGCCSASNMFADGSGRFSTTRQLMGPGAYTVYASVYSSRRWHVVATWSFQA